MNPIARIVLIVVYSILGLAAVGRASYQIIEKFSDAPIAYTVSAISAALYVLIAVALWRRWENVALVGSSVELAGVLTVGTLSIVPVPSRGHLAAYTRKVVANDGFDHTGKQPVAGAVVPRHLGEASPIKHVIYVVRENRTFDQELGSLGKGNGDAKNLDDIYYNTGLAMYSVMFEGVRQAIKKDGWPLTPKKIKDGLESLRNFDANGLLAPVTVTARDHGGGGKTRIDMWDGSKWVPQSDWISAYTDVVDKVVKEQSAEFAKSGK